MIGSIDSSALEALINDLVYGLILIKSKLQLEDIL